MLFGWQKREKSGWNPLQKDSASNYWNILKVETLICPLFFLLPLDHDIILSSLVTSIAIYTTNISLRTPKVRLDIDLVY